MESVACVSLVLARLLQEFFDEAGCFELAEGLDAFAKPVLCERLDLVFVQVVLADDLLNQVFLFGRAVPGAVVGPLGMSGAASAVPAVALSTSVAVRGRQIPGFLNMRGSWGWIQLIIPLGRLELAEGDRGPW